MTFLTNKLKRWLSVLLSLTLIILIAKQLSNKQELEQAWLVLLQNWNTKKSIQLLFVAILMLCNWSIEALKWKMLLAKVEQLNLWRSLKSVLLGVSVSILTPNRVGEYGGRIIVLHEKNAAKGISINIVSSLSQFIAASAFGLYGSVYYFLCVKKIWYLPLVIAGTIVGILILIILYFGIGKVSDWLAQKKVLAKIKTALHSLHNISAFQLRQSIALSTLRYFIFALQFYILLLALDVHISFGAALPSIFLIFWLMAILPSIAIAELPLRAELSYQILGNLHASSASIMSASVLLWLINLIVPATCGAILLWAMRWQKKQSNS